MSTATRTSAAKFSRGVAVSPPPHPQAVETAEDLKALAAAASGPIAADLFCGAGGLSLGLRDAGFEVLVGVDNDTEALETHRSLLPGLHLDWDLGDADRVEELAQLLGDIGVDLIAGGPPCQPFSKAGRSMIRDLVRKGQRPGQDQRRDLWQSFLAVVERVQPSAVLMENVPDMALEPDMLILRTMVDELERLGYAVDARVIETSRYGVPQWRQRLILVALAEGRRFDWPHERPNAELEHNSLWDAIGDLPDVTPGWASANDQQSVDYGEPTTRLQVRARRNVPPSDTHLVFDHSTRAVREDDLEAFELLTPEMKYSQLPTHLKRYRDDIFDDKYKRLEKYAPCRTITAHIAKDGYWYIHPEFNRTLTVREAARVQTFTDDVRFAGTPTAAFRQIGNAVPPMLGEGLGSALLEALEGHRPADRSTRQMSRGLATWFESREDLTIPWLRAETRWVAVQAEILLGRARPDAVRHLWRFLSRLKDPYATVEKASVLRRLARMADREHRAQDIVDIAATLIGEPALLGSREGMRKAGVPPAAVDMAMRVRPTGDEDPVIAPTPLLRVAQRVHGSNVDARNKRSDGRIEVARLVGVDPEDEPAPRASSPRRTGHLAHLALFELANDICLPRAPRCGECPLESSCAFASGEVRPVA